jgi:hypothetical protein
LFADPMQLLLVLGRPTFEYQLLCSAQLAQDPATALDGSDADSQQFSSSSSSGGDTPASTTVFDIHCQLFQQSLQWLGTRIAMLNTTQDPSDPAFLTSCGLPLQAAPDQDPPPSATQAVLQPHLPVYPWTSAVQQAARKQLMAAYTQMYNAVQAKLPLDMFAVSMDMIEYPNISLQDVLDCAVTLTGIEADLASVKAGADVQAAQDMASSAAVVKLQQAVDDYPQVERPKLYGKLNSQWTAVQAAMSASTAAGQTVTTALTPFWDSIKASFTCGQASQVMSAVGNVLLMANPEAGALSKLGGLLSIGAAASNATSTLPTAEGDTNPAVLRGQLYTLAATITDTQAFQAAISRISSTLSLSDAGTSYVDAVIAERTTFQSLCEQYFSDPKLLTSREASDIATLKADFNTHVAAAQTLHQAVLTYNQRAVKLANADLQYAKNRAALASRLVLPAGDSGALAPTALAFYQNAYSYQKMQALRQLFDAIRAINGALLARCSVLDDL